MKHSPPPAKSGPTRCILLAIGVGVLALACASGTQVLPGAVNYSFAEANSARGRRVNINRASAAELESLPGIGKAIADRIIAHRQRYGPFRRAEHLLIVRGISDRKFRAIQPVIAVE